MLQADAPHPFLAVTGFHEGRAAMGEGSSFQVSDGFPPDQQSRAAEMFWEAFRGKLQSFMVPDTKALRYIETVLCASHAIGATREDGLLIGIAGFKTESGALVGGGLRELQSVYGWVGGAGRGLLLSLLERPLQPDTLTMDGIMVSAEARGRGVGAALLSALKSKAVEVGCSRVRLDVIDANPRARALYERQGFVAQGAQDIGPLRHIFGFRKSTTMICEV